MSQAVWRRYLQGRDWVTEVSYLALLGMEACLIYAWQGLAFSWLSHPGVPVWGVLALLWAAYLAASLINQTTLTEDRRQAVVAALLIASTLLAIRLFVYPDRPLGSLGWIGDMANALFSLSRVPPELFTVFVVLVAWWRGITASRQDYQTANVWFHFRVGILLLFGYLFFAMFVRDGRDDALLILAFFFCGLISIALARILELGGIHASTLGSRQWLGVLAGSTAASLGLAMLVTAVFSRETLRTILGWFRPLIDVLSTLAWYLAATILYLLWPLLDWALSGLVQAVERASPEMESLFGSPVQSPLQTAESAEPAQIYPWCRTLVVAAVLLVGLLLVARLIRKLARERAEKEDMERESLLSGAALINDLQAGWRNALARLQALADRLGGAHRRSIASIRKIYASMVDLATEAGYARRSAQTPYEYRATLYQAFGGAQEAVDTITEAYVRTHYGEVPESEAEMQQIRSSWQLLEGQIVLRPEPEDQE